LIASRFQSGSRGRQTCNTSLTSWLYIQVMAVGLIEQFRTR
jgi:hypothetical protein